MKLNNITNIINKNNMINKFKKKREFNSIFKYYSIGFVGYNYL